MIAEETRDLPLKLNTITFRPYLAHDLESRTTIMIPGLDGPRLEDLTSCGSGCTSCRKKLLW
jgi:hypothetical protein